MVAAAAALAFAVRQEGREAAAFSGPAVEVDADPPAYYQPLRYDLTAYAAHDSLPFLVRGGTQDQGQAYDAGEASWVDGAGSRALQGTMERAQRRGAVGTPSELRLLSPSVYTERARSRNLLLVYPPQGAVFPPNLCAPRVEWEDANNDLWQVRIGVGSSGREWSAVTRDHAWWVPDDIWQGLRQEAGGDGAWVEVRGLRRAGGPVQASHRVRFGFSKWPADDFVVYRMVVPPFNTRKTPDTFYRDIRTRQERPFLLARDGYCFNCHAFSAKTGTSGKVAIQARYMSPGAALPVYVGVYDFDQHRGWKVKLPFDIQMSTYMNWSADGRYLAMSANQQLVTFVPTVYETQYAGEPTSDVAVYDAVNNTTRLVPGADDPDRLELLPCFSVDGQRMVFASAPAGLHPAQTKYELFEIPFNGGAGGTPRPVPGAAGNGRSNYYPRFSPDGRWFSFCQADVGILIKSSSDLYLAPASLDRPAWRLECNVEFAADSWHSWSSNSHWLVFASKRDDGILARLYLTQIDAEGHASPAVRLPLGEEPFASFNIPEFAAQAPAVAEPDLFEVMRVEAPAVAAQAEGRAQ